MTQDVNTANCNNGFLSTMSKIGFDLNKIRLVINKAQPAKMVAISTDELVEAFINPLTNDQYPCVGKIKYDNEVKHMNNLGKPLVYNSSSDFTKSIGAIASEVIGEEFTLGVPEKDWKIKSATVSQYGDGTYYISILFEYENFPVSPVPVTEEQVVGLDYKSAGLYVDSNGKCQNMPGYYRMAQMKLAKKQRKLRHKVPGSRNYQKQQKRIARVYRHITNQRKDYLHKLSAAIAKQYAYVCVENLNMRSMSNKGFGNGKATLDNGYGMFLAMLDYKLAGSGGKLVKVDKFFPSSQICHCCGCRNPEVRGLHIREWICPDCGEVHDRDANAAKNIKTEGLRILLAA